MTQNRYSVLVGLFLLLLLTGGFFVASRVLINKVDNKIAAANATSTPTVAPPATPTLAPTSVSAAGRTHPAARPTSTPVPSAVTVYIAATNNISAAADTLPANTGVFYCMVNLPNIPLSTQITFKWQSLPNGTGIYTFSGSYPTAYKYSYVDGPFSPGQDRCVISALVNGVEQTLGSKTFTVG